MKSGAVGRCEGKGKKCWMDEMVGMMDQEGRWLWECGREGGEKGVGFVGKGLKRELVRCRMQF